MPTSSGIQNPSYSRLLVVTDLWQTSQISGLRIAALRIRRHNTSAPKICWGRQMRGSKMPTLLWFLNCHMLPRFVEFVSVL